MYPNDSCMPQGSELSDLLHDNGQVSSAGGIENISVGSTSQGHAYLGTAGPKAFVGDEDYWPSYRPYEPELAPPVRYERLTPPPPAPFPEPEPDPARYEDCSKLLALYDWRAQQERDSTLLAPDEWS